MSHATVTDLEPTLDAHVPEYMAWLRAQDESTWERDAVAAKGRWPRRDTRMWGSRTRALWDDVQTPG